MRNSQCATDGRQRSVDNSWCTLVGGKEPVVWVQEVDQTQDAAGVKPQADLIKLQQQMQQMEERILGKLGTGIQKLNFWDEGWSFPGTSSGTEYRVPVHVRTVAIRFEWHAVHA